MKMLEHQAKRLLAGYGVPVPEGVVCRSKAEAVAAWELLVEAPRPSAAGDRLGEGPSSGGVDQGLVLKAQVPSGKRGRGGGILVARAQPRRGRQSLACWPRRFVGFPVPEVLAEHLQPAGGELYLSVLTGTAPSTPGR